MNEPGQDVPLAPTRRAHLLETIARDGEVKVVRASQTLGVTPMTIRRDLTALEQEGLVHRVRGGAVASWTAEPRTAARASDDWLAVLVPSFDYYWPEVVRGIESEAASHGYRLVVRGSPRDTPDERPAIARLIRMPQVKGLLLAPNTTSPFFQDTLVRLRTSGVPHVLVERDAVLLPQHEAIDSVTTDHALGAVMAAYHLAGLGHRRIGAAFAYHSPHTARLALGWRAACRQLGLRDDEHFETRIHDHTSPDFQATVGKLVQRTLAAGATALFAHADPEAIAIVQHLQDLGMRVPGDLSVIAYGDEIAGVFNPSITAVHPPRSAVGVSAVRLLQRRIAEPTLPVHKIVLSPRLNIRDSTGALTAAASA